MKPIVALFTALLLAGCAHPAPRAITLPTTAAVGHAVTVAQGANQRAVQIVARAQKTGLAAGSPELRELSATLDQVTVKLAVAQGQVNTLTAQLLTAQRATDAQTAKLAWYVTKYDEAVKTIWWYRTHFLFPLIGAGVLLAATVAVVLLSKFTAWGARTFGPYLVDAEHLAVKAAVLA